MVKRLYLLRHAKSDYPDGVDDHERPLNARGRKVVLQMADYVKTNIPCPDKILCSTALRAKQTAAGVVKAWENVGDITYVRNLYLASPGEILKELATLDEAVHSVMVVGHNPGIAMLAALLFKQGNDKAYQQMRSKYPTAGLAAFSLQGTWKHIEPQSAALESFMTPAQLDASEVDDD